MKLSKKGIIIALTIYEVIAIVVSVFVITNFNCGFTQMAMLGIITFDVFAVIMLVNHYKYCRNYADSKVPERTAIVLVIIIVTVMFVCWYAIIRYKLVYSIGGFLL